MEWALHLLVNNRNPSAAWSSALAQSWQSALTMVHEVVLLTRDLLNIHQEPEVAEAEKQLFGVLQRWATRLGGMQAGDCALIPVAWPDLSRGGVLHAALVLVEKASNDTGTLTVVNEMGSGSEYHPRQLRGPPTRPTLCSLPLRVGPVRWSRLSNSTFWLYMLRPLVKQTLEDPHPALMYEALLPFLNRRGRREQLAAQLEAAGCDEDWRAVPASDASLVHTAFHALLIGLRIRERGTECDGDSVWTLLALQWEALKLAVGEVTTQSSHMFVRESCRGLARAAAAVSKQAKSRGLPSASWHATLLESLLGWLRSRLMEVERMSTAMQVLPEAPREWNVPVTSCAFGGFERASVCEDGTALAGEPERPDVVLPVPLVQVGGSVGSYHDAAVAVERCVRACSLLANQRDLVTYADYHIVSLVQNLFFAVLPVPTPRLHPAAGCFWRREPMEQETQLLLLNQIGQVLRYFLAASLSLPRTTHLHAMRLLTLAAAVVVIDAICRRVQKNGNSEFARVYSGALRADLACSAFALCPVALAEETKDTPLTDPCAMQLRTRLLDYLAEAPAGEAGADAGKAPGAASRRSVLAFADMRLSCADQELLHRLALVAGFARGSKPDRIKLSRFFTGQVPEFLSRFPGVAVLRDATFLLRLFCIPLTCSPQERRRPDGNSWRAGDFELRWDYSAEDDVMKVYGLQRKLSLEPGEFLPKDNSSSSFVKRMSATFFGKQGAERRVASAASPSELAGQPIGSEDDALHAPELPAFDGLLLPSDCEQLLSFLTVPYLRVPLVLQLFNDRTRLSALACQQLQAMFDAVLFEPGPFAALSAPPLPCPSVVAPLARGPLADAALATPAGRFVHELVYSTTAQMELDGIFRLAMERDMPAYTPAAAAVLYVVRLWARSVAYVGAVVRHSSGLTEPVRGFDGLAKDKLEALHARAQNWRARLHLEAVPTLERWCRRAMETGSIDVACALWLHLALVFRWEEELTLHGVSTLLCAEVFVNSNLHASSGRGERMARACEETLGFSYSEVFELFHATRPQVYAWLKSKEQGGDASRALEHVVSVVASSQTMAQHSEEGTMLGRRWRELERTWEGSGRFAPSAPRAADIAWAEEDFSRWLAASVDSAPVEVNVNIGQLQFRQHTVTPVPRQVLALPEFREVFPGIDIDAASLMWALVEKAPRRERYRFAGLRYEFRLWKSEESLPVCHWTRDLRKSISEEEAWIKAAICSHPELNDLWPRSRWFVPEEAQVGEVVRIIVYAGTVERDGSEPYDWENMYVDPYGMHSPTGRRGSRGAALQVPRVKEVELFRAPTTPSRAVVVHVYDVVRCGPWSARVQTSTSDAAWSYACRSLGSGRDLSSPPTSRRSGRKNSLTSSHEGDQPLNRMPSLEITHEDSSGESVLVPRRFLAGALPDCLLETYEFWRAQPTRLLGRMQTVARRQASAPTALVVQLNDAGAAYVQRIELDATGRTEEAKQVDRLMHAEPKGSAMRGCMLVDLLRAPRSSRAWEIAQWALLLDDLSNVLAWTQGEVVAGELQTSGNPYIESVEFPRLGLTFTGSSIDRRLRCDQHGGLRVVEGPVMESTLLRILRPFPRFILLQDDAEEMFALVSLGDRPVRSADGLGVCLARGEEDWLDNLRVDHRHQLFHIHASHEFLTAPTMVAQLHLMLLRVLQNMYVEACCDVAACMATGLPREPEEIFVWEELTETLRDDACVDAAVLRLKLMLQIQRQGLGPPEGWDLESDLVRWTHCGDSCVAGRMLTAAEDAALLELCSGTTVWELRARREVHTTFLGLEAATGHCTQHRPEKAGALVSVERGDGDPIDAGPLVRGKVLLDRFETQAPLEPDEAVLRCFAHDREPQPEDAGPQKTGMMAVAWLLHRLPLQLPRDFILLYELVTGAKKIWLAPSDDAALTGELLAYLVPPGVLAGCPSLGALIRAVEYYPSVAKRLPVYQGDAEDFMVRLCRAVGEEGDALRVPPAPQAANGIAGRSEWTFKLCDDGSWELAHHDNEYMQVLSPTPIDRAGPLTNPRLFSLVNSLKSFDDRRQPSLVWDWDCQSRNWTRPSAEATFKETCDDFAKRMPGLPFDQLPSLTTRPLLAPTGANVTWGPSWSSGFARSAFALDAAILERCSSMQTAAGRKLLRRIQADSASVSTAVEEPRLMDLKGRSIFEILVDQEETAKLLQEVQRLKDKLVKMLKEDRINMLRAVNVVVELASGAGRDAEGETLDTTVAKLGQRLGQLGGSEAAPTFQDVLQMLLVQRGLEEVLPHTNPLVQGSAAGDIAAASALAMLLSTRTIIGRRCMGHLSRLAELLSQATADQSFSTTPAPKAKARASVKNWLSRTLLGGKAQQQAGQAGAEDVAQLAASERAWAIAEAAEQAARELVTEQHCVEGARYDPRLLCFEFISRLALRGKQVKLVRGMLGAVDEGRPLVHQMLMGEGKTTVVTPLVVLLAATAERACVVCCPAAILNFTCRVLRERLRAALARPVMVFEFARVTEVSEDLYLRLLLAQDTRAALCTGPTAVKSLMLRFLLTVHDIDITRSRERERHESKKNSRRSLMQSLLAWPSQMAPALSSKEQLKKLRFEAEVLGSAFRVFKGSILLLDDIDLLMHPLRSELHWPLGDTHTLDFTAALGTQSSSIAVPGRDTGRAALASFVSGSPIGARWQAAFHLLDAFFSCAMSDGPSVASFCEQTVAAGVMKRLRAKVERGLQEKHLQASPHLALLSTTFYHDELRPILAEWMLLWIRRRHPIVVPDSVLLAYLCGSKVDEKVIPELGDHQLKALNLSRTWLAVLMPHLASRIHRVHYGLLAEGCPSWAQEPRARRFFAVPFVGKDAPSDSSQFSHPDVVIGLTWLSFRLGGLRHGDFEQALVSLLRLERSEVDVPPRLRTAHRLYNAWVSEARGYVRGEIKGDLNQELPTDNDILALQSSGRGEQSAAAPLRLVPPLEWLDICDEAQVSKVRNVLRTSPFLMEFYLHEDVFPKLLRHADAKLSASGQDLGGEMLCGSRLGFSGTPNDLLPRALGSCVYARGDDTKMLHTLSDPAVVDICPIREGWGARSLLEMVAAVRPPLSALIDVGALITGLSNIEVAQALLDSDLPFEGVVFCETGGEQQLLRRGQREPVRLAHCTLPPERRFVFYDQVHTTGIDIRHAPGARAALTLGKDTTFRDYAQGAYRMRGVGRGQRLMVLLTPEVTARVRAEVSLQTPPTPTSGAPPSPRSERSQNDRQPSASPQSSRCFDSEGPRIGNEAVAAADVERTGMELSGSPPGPVLLREVQPGSWAEKSGFRRGDELLSINGAEIATMTAESVSQACQQRPLKLSIAGMLDRVCSWLLCRQAAAEHTQHHLLRKQAVEHEGRRCAYQVLSETYRAGIHGSIPASPYMTSLEDDEDDRPKEPGPDVGALELFRERVDYTIDTTLYGFSCSHVASMENYMERVRSLLDEAGSKVVQDLINSVPGADVMEVSGEEEQALFAEMEQEHEMELFAEQEQEKEQEEEEQQEEEHELGDPEHSPVSVWQSLKRDDPPRQWPLAWLALPSSMEQAFYRASQFQMPSQAGRRDLCVDFPPSLWMSRNFCPPHGGRVLRRLRTPTVLLEWVPDDAQLDLSEKTGDPSKGLLPRLKLAMEVLGMDSIGNATPEAVVALLRTLGIDVRREEVGRVCEKIQRAAEDELAKTGGQLSPEQLAKSRLSPEVVAEGIRRAHVLEAQPGRHYALLSLAEAEVVRLALHARADREAFLEDKPGCMVALRVLRRDPAGLGVLEASRNWQPAPFKWQAGALAQCCLFLDAEMSYSTKDAQSLRDILRGGPLAGGAGSRRPGDPDIIRDFWLASYAVRRRPQPALWMEHPVARLFVGDDEHLRAKHEATLREAYARLLEVGLTPEAAFQLLDQDQDDTVRAEDLRASRARGLGLPEELLLHLWEAVEASSAASGGIRRAVWVAAFDNSDPQRSAAAAAAAISAGEPLAPPAAVPLDVLRRIVIELVPHAAFSPVWTSEGTMARRKLSLWAADQLVSGFLRVTALRLSLGDYANQGFTDARGGGGPGGVGKRLILQVRDKRWAASSGDSATTEEFLRSVADHYCPAPVKFRHVWSQRRGTALFIWRPVPPSDAFVALGMVATTAPEPPSVDRVRCIAKSFCRPATQAPVMLWDDSGCGGKPASMWLVNSPQALWVTSGRTLPQETFWELAADTITFDYTGKPSVFMVHEKQAAPASSPKGGTPPKKLSFFQRRQGLA